MSGYRFGYGTNGFADHTLSTALDVMQAYGYQAVALTIGPPHLDCFADDWRERTQECAADLRRRDFRCVVETGTRYLLDPMVKHRPTLVDVDAAVRMRFLERAVEIAAILQADCVSLWSGVLPAQVSRQQAWQLLRERLTSLAEFAATHQVRLSVEPEPGMVIETVADACELVEQIGSPPHVGITVDLGHCVAVEPDGVVGALRQAGTRLFNVQVDDMLPGVHEHLELGTGQLDLAAALRTLDEIGYRGIAAIELPRHSHDAPRLARTSMEVLQMTRTQLAAGRSSHTWVSEARDRVVANPDALVRAVAEAGRAVPGLGDADVHRLRRDLVATALLRHSAGKPDGDVTVDRQGLAVVGELYDRGSSAERLAALDGLGAAAATVQQHGDEGRDDILAPLLDLGRRLLQDALRTNDPSLVTGAMTSDLTAELDQHTWRHGVLKLVFMGRSVAEVTGLSRRRDAELAVMAERFAAERRAAGRTVPPDLVLLGAEAS